MPGGFGAIGDFFGEGGGFQSFSASLKNVAGAVETVQGLRNKIRGLSQKEAKLFQGFDLSQVLGVAGGRLSNAVGRGDGGRRPGDEWTDEFGNRWTMTASGFPVLVESDPRPMRGEAGPGNVALLGAVALLAVLAFSR